jgi:hypothetical protein
MSEKIKRRVQERFSSSNRSPFVEEMYDECFELFKEWENNQSFSDLDERSTQQKILDSRLSLKLFIKKRVKREKRNSIIPSFIWWWLLNQVVTYIVKLIIESYFLSKQFSEEDESEITEFVDSHAEAHYIPAPKVDKSLASQWSVDVLIYWAFDDHTEYSVVQRDKQFFLYKETRVQEAFATEEELKNFLLSKIQDD